MRFFDWLFRRPEKHDCGSGPLRYLDIIFDDNATCALGVINSVADNCSVTLEWTNARITMDAGEWRRIATFAQKVTA